MMLFIDSDPLLLLLVGTYDNSMIGRFKRIKKYTNLDFDVLVQFLTKKRVFVTPGVLAEVSNFAEELGNKRFQEFVDRNMENLREMSELYIGKDIIIASSEFRQLGFTDTSIMLVAKEHGGEVLTADHHLCGKCGKMGIPAHHMIELQERAKQFM